MFGLDIFQPPSGGDKQIFLRSATTAPSSTAQLGLPEFGFRIEIHCSDGQASPAERGVGQAGALLTSIAG
jgi:hypothetical protein